MSTNEDSQKQEFQSLEDLRLFYKTLAASNSESRLEKDSDTLCFILIEFFKENSLNHKNIALFHANKNWDEPNLKSIWSKDSSDFVCPSINESNEMTFHPFNALSLIQDKKFNFLNSKIKSSSKAPQIVLCPGLIFDHNGRRIGRGGGHYDRYLNQNNCLKIGLSFENYILEEIPSQFIQNHDQNMDYIISESSIYICPQKGEH